MMDREVRLRLALDAALARYDERVEEPFPHHVELEIEPAHEFLAVVYPTTTGVTIEASATVVDRLEHAWDRSLELSAALPISRQITLLGHADHVVDVALRWLMQHELNHVAVGHFNLTTGAGLIEGGGDKQFNVASREPRQPSPLDSLTPAEQQLAPLCLELQADHDATEIVLGAYSRENHKLFCYYSICIALVIVVIERVDRERGTQSKTHPTASTRLFMLLAYLVELPMIPAYKRAFREGLENIPEEYCPDDAELSEYGQFVLEPVFSACQIICEAVGLPKLLDELGGAESFFDDIQSAVHGGHENRGKFKTACAIQWAELKPLNNRLLKMLGW